MLLYHKGNHLINVISYNVNLLINVIISYKGNQLINIISYKGNQLMNVIISLLQLEEC